MIRWSSLLALVAGATVSFAASSARADCTGNVFDDCGGAVVNGNEMCSAVVSGGCSAACSPPNLQIACDANLEASCMGGCTATLPSCNTSCEASCMGTCTSNPGNFSCTGSCGASCEGNCMGTCTSQCMSSSNMSSCMSTCTGQCNASCTAHCNASCMGTPPSASCSGQCQASCSGSCSGQANLSCDVMCQAMGSASCTTSGSVFNNCNASCNAKGAIVCDGNFINAADADCCANDLKSIVTITGWSYANASAGCDGGTCTAEAAAGAGGSVSCDMAPGTPPLSGGLLGLGLGATVFGLVRRRRAGK